VEELYPRDNELQQRFNYIFADRIRWALTGDTSEQCMFILFGSGANGKSTFLNTIMYLLGDYAIATPTETFMWKTGDQITNDIARLRGTRFVTTTEAEQGRRLSEPLIKQITGNDRMTTRFLYGEFFNFVPTFKIFMATNHKPVIKGTDHGIWRRIKLIPFTTRIEEEKQDKHLEEKLRAEASGILNWMLEGTRRRPGRAAPAIHPAAWGD
jgi:putative DNA primase/helicase